MIRMGKSICHKWVNFVVSDRAKKNPDLSDRSVSETVVLEP